MIWERHARPLLTSTRLPSASNQQSLCFPLDLVVEFFLVSLFGWDLPTHDQVCMANANATQASGAETDANVAAGPLPTGVITRPPASVFREFEVEVRPEPPPPPVAPDGRTAEDTLIERMGLGGNEGALWFRSGDRKPHNNSAFSANSRSSSERNKLVCRRQTVSA